MLTAFPAEMDTQHSNFEESVAEACIFTRTVQLPRNLRECIQDVDNYFGFTIKHKLEIDIKLRSTAGHVTKASPYCFSNVRLIHRY